MDFDKAKIIHFVGIGGCGMSAIAKILSEMGRTVQGSDAKESPNTMRLKDLGVKVFIGHDKSHVRGADIVVYSSAIHKENAELKAAKAAKTPIVARADALSYILDHFPEKITVAGTHGKTTTTSMISTMLAKGNLNPTYIIGAEADTIDGNAKLGSGKFVVAEADESDGSFLKFHPTISIVTNIEPDHMEYYKTVGRLLETFNDFIKLLPESGCLIINSDNENNKKLIGKLPEGLKFITYGFGPDADIRAGEIRAEENSTHFEVFHKDKLLGDMMLSVPGKQNVENSLAAIAVGIEAGLSFGAIRDGLRYFRGVKRRFQHIGTQKDIMVVDDYAHHPTELMATLSAARAGWGKERRIICVFQPHRYTRTMFLHKEFGQAFGNADIVIITDIYSAGEEPIEGITAKLIYEEIKSNPGVDVHYIPKKEKITDYLLKIAKPNDIVITAGAGDIHTVGKEFLTRLKESDGEKK